MLRRTGTGWTAVALIALAASANAQWVQQDGKLVGSGGVGGPAAGISVALSADGNTAIVGAPGDADGAGAAWVFTRSNGQWMQQGSKLVGSGADGVAGQGRSVALSADGNTAVVGGPNDHTGTGAMWVFVRSNGVWSQQGSKLWGTVLLGIAHQGISVGLSADGNTAIVGGDLDTNFVGAAWVFRRTNGVWSIFPDKLVGAGSTGMSHQGAAVALSADGATALVGGPGDNNGLGSAWVFTFGNGAWAQQGAKLSGVGASLNADFGVSVALSGDGNTALVGGDGDGGSAGAVWVFTRSNGLWAQQGDKLSGSAVAAGRYLGESVALSGDGNIALAGGPGGITTKLFGRSPAVGATWAFQRANGAWFQQSVMAGSGTATNDALQGTAVAVSTDGGTALVGGPVDNNGAGAVWVFTRPAAQSPPLITAQPVGQTITSGQTATLSVTASGPATLSYQWYQGAKGDTATPLGGNYSTFTTPALTSTTSFWVRVSNSFGSADSSAALVTIAPGGPAISGVFNAASHVPTIAANSWVEIKGTNLAPAGATREWQTSDFANGQMPAQLEGVSATVNGKKAYVYYISPAQVNILTPPDALAGPVEVQLTNSGILSAPFVVQAQAIAPAFFVIGAGPYIAAEHANGTYLGPPSLYPGVMSPAKPGEIVVLFGNGFGPTSTPVIAGSQVQSGTLATLPAIQIGGVTARVQYGGLIGPGVYQFNVEVPQGTPDGDNAVTALYNGIVTQAGVMLPVAR